MSLFTQEPKEDILIKVYPTYQLYGRIYTKNKAQYEKTHDDDLILYKFCNNGILNIPDYQDLMTKQRKKEKQEHLQHRLDLGFKST